MKKENKGKVGRVISTIFICLLIVILMGAGTFFAVQKMGASRLAKNATSEVPVMEQVKTDLDFQNEEEIIPEATDELKPGEIIYNGRKYAYNNDILSFVVMGVDSRDDVSQLLENVTGSQSDFIFVVVADRRNKEIKLIGINRNTMTDVWVCDDQYNYYDTEYAQITLQHSFGTGGADSCEKTVAAVDNILYSIPIHGYFSMNMGAITKLNDAVGGVELIATEDVPYSDIKKGDKVLLMGDDAYDYLHNRDWGADHSGSADARLVRQKQYLSKFVPKVIEMAKKDISVPLNILKIIEDYSVTDITTDEVTYLLSQVINYKFDVSKIYSLKGETVLNTKTNYDEFYLDEDALYKTVVDIFYEPVN